MITVYYRNDPAQGCVIRPTPLVSISHNPIKNKLGTLGANYTITLTGTIISDEGSPIYSNNGDPLKGPLSKFNQIGPNWDDLTSSSSRPQHESVAFGSKLSAIFTKQQAIRELFAIDGQKIEISPITGDEAVIICFPTIESINFEEGVYVDICRYTITLTADTLLDSNGNVFIEGRIGSVFAPSGNETYISEDGRVTELTLLNQFGGFIEDFNDTWSIEVDEGNGETSTNVGVGFKNIPRSYRITRNISATGKTRYIPENDLTTVKRYEAWEQARDFIKKKILVTNEASGYYNYPGLNLAHVYSSGFLNIPSVYKGYNHVRTENIDKAAGSYNITDTWLMASGDKALENYDLSVRSSIDAPFITVNINGSIKGLSDIPASGYSSTITESPYDRALQKYYEISNSGQFGIGSNLYKRANNSVAQVLNSQPGSISLGMNEFTGEITYSLEFNNRPTNFFTGVLAENISVNDTYPGDVFAVIPVLGRQTGPILQYIGGRTEYRRDVQIEIVLDYTDIGYNNNRESLLLRKPSLNEPLRSQLLNLILQVSPSGEPGIRKYFISPPTENWSPKDGRYSLSLSWTYELGY